MATYRRELAETASYPRAIGHKNYVRSVRQNIDNMRFDLLTMQKCLGDGNHVISITPVYETVT